MLSIHENNVAFHSRFNYILNPEFTAVEMLTHITDISPFIFEKIPV